MKNSNHLDWFALERLYDEGRELVLRGKYEEAIEKFKRVYEDTVDLRDVAQIVADYFAMPPEQWLAKHQARFHK